MALARWKDLCIDVVDPERMGPFWAAALGLDLHVRDRDAMRYLTGPGADPAPELTVWLNPVPEPVTVKQRVHPDLHVASVDDLLALGAQPLDLDTHRWAVLRDPEGGELCAFERAPAELPSYRLHELAVDGERPVETATWWAQVLGGRVGRDDAEGWAWVERAPGMPFDAIVFAAVPEPKKVKNRVHWDLWVPDVDALVERGARVLREPGDDGAGTIAWTVLVDPEGNEFCAFAGGPEPEDARE